MNQLRQRNAKSCILTPKWYIWKGMSYFQDKTFFFFILLKCHFTKVLKSKTLLSTHHVLGMWVSFPQAQACGERRPFLPGGLGGFTLEGKLALRFTCRFSGRHLWNDCTAMKDSFYIIQDCPGSLSSERKKSHMNYLQSIKLFPFMSSDFVFVSANWDFVYPWIVFPGAWKI